MTVIREKREGKDRDLSRDHSWCRGLLTTSYEESRGDGTLRNGRTGLRVNECQKVSVTRVSTEVIKNDRRNKVRSYISLRVLKDF